MTAGDAPPLSRARSGPPSLIRGLRPRVLLISLLIVAPAFALAFIWALNRDVMLRRAQFYAGEAAATLAAERFDRLYEEAADLAETVSGSGCAIGAEALARHADFDAGFLIDPATETCTGLEPALLAPLKGLSQGGFIGGSTEPPLMIALPLPGSGPRLLVLRVAPASVDRILALDGGPPLDGMALVGAAGLAVERHRAEAPSDWLPAALPPGAAAGRHQLAAADGDQRGYLLEPVAHVPATMVVALEPLPFLGMGPWPLWTTLLPAAAVLVVLIAGVIWAVERSVLRWIVYLRRIATAHSRGHHSVRANMKGAARELAELGESLNHMANDAGRRAAQLHETAQEKGALLTELHHRVKNNFQVITSLLSLHRQDLPTERREEIRFVEDYVRAMAVAYRVAYDSGDVTGVCLQDLLRTVLAALRESADAPQDRIALTLEEERIWIDLDKAISLGLYLAAVLPPYLKALSSCAPSMLTIAAMRDQGMLRLSIDGPEPIGADRPPLRAKLLTSYLRQLKATSRPVGRPHMLMTMVPLDARAQTHRLASLTPAEAEPATAPLTEDIAEREQRLNLLMRETTHRSKNILAVIDAIARQSLGHATSLDDFGRSFSARLQSLAESHNLLTQVEWSGTRLHDLMRAQVGHFLDGPSQITLEGPDLSLAPLAVPYVGLALHELSTNAAKHGALSVPEGRVTIRWGLAGEAGADERLWLRWTETGGPPVVPPTRRGFGADVTRRLVARALRGKVTLDFVESGIVWHLDAAAANLIVRAAAAAPVRQEAVF